MDNEEESKESKDTSLKSFGGKVAIVAGGVIAVVLVVKLLGKIIGVIFGLLILAAALYGILKLIQASKQ